MSKCEHYTYSLALEADCSPILSSGIRQSAPLNGMPTAARSCENEPTNGSPACTCTKETFGCSIHPTGKAEWIASMRDSLARIYPWLVARPEWAKAQEAVCTGKSCVSLAWFDRDTCSWKTSQRSVLGGWESYSGTWPRWGLMLDGVAYALPTLERPTSEIGGGLWPTPSVCGNYNRKGASKTSGDGLATAVKMWPTPLARDSRTVRGGGKDEELNRIGAADYAGGASGEQAGWSVEPNVGRVVDGVPARVDRIKALGNAQVPLQAAVAWKILMGEE